MRQYFIKKNLNVNEKVIFENDVAHHIKDVLRMNDGDAVRLVDENGKCYVGKIIIDENVGALIETEIESNTCSNITCIAALIKKDKWEYLVQKAAEIGASRIVPLITKRTIIDLSSKDINKKLERWNKIALEACQQCNRSDICKVEEPIEIKEIDQYLSDINIAAYEKENSCYIANKLLKDKSISFVIGPEGGFEKKEIEQLEEKGFEAVHLGKRILRAETAVLYTLSVIDEVNNG